MQNASLFPWVHYFLKHWKPSAISGDNPTGITKSMSFGIWQTVISQIYSVNKDIPEWNWRHSLWYLFWTRSFSINSQTTLNFKKLGLPQFVLFNINILKCNALCSAKCFCIYYPFIYSFNKYCASRKHKMLQGIQNYWPNLFAMELKIQKRCNSTI